MTSQDHHPEAGGGAPKRDAYGGLRQLFFPAEFRIDRPDAAWTTPSAPPASHGSPPASGAGIERKTERLLAELATCLWYIKRKHFKQEWDDIEADDDDPRVRRTLGRLNKSVEALKEAGLEVHDPTRERYPPGGEAMMKPIQFEPMAGITHEMVSETVCPIVYLDDRLIQRAEVFVSVPKEGVQSSPPPPAEAEAGTAGEQEEPAAQGPPETDQPEENSH